MNVAVVGCTGYIASSLIDTLRNKADIEKIVEISHKDKKDHSLELQNASSFNYSILDDIDYVIFTAAISSPDQCAVNYDHCRDINVIGTEYFIRKAISKGCRVIFFSSDAVYGDIKGKIYDENSATCPTTPYGCMKKEVEDAFLDSPLFKVIRLSYVFSSKDKFTKYCLSCIDNHLEAEIYHPFYRNCIALSDVIQIVVWLIDNWDVYEHNIVNAVGRELISRVRIADEINRFLKEPLTYSIVYPTEAFYKHRPQITQVESLYLIKYKVIQERSFSESVKRELEGLI